MADEGNAMLMAFGDRLAVIEAQREQMKLAERDLKEDAEAEGIDWGAFKLARRLARKNASAQSKFIQTFEDASSQFCLFEEAGSPAGAALEEAAEALGRSGLGVSSVSQMYDALKVSASDEASKE